MPLHFFDMFASYVAAARARASARRVTVDTRYAVLAGWKIARSFERVENMPLRVVVMLMMPLLMLLRVYAAYHCLFHAAALICRRYRFVDTLMLRRVMPLDAAYCRFIFAMFCRRLICYF